ncbi:hypothetical protein M431DRAFT_413061 [Trichoderma harzianum CBS 226.95]|uniref:Uncharacterized protein n=1 Tax=Trichoderma harzianum CBS 226.95 TaxID=983964 RepID=A0A2T4AFT0_TRIHA|nr:hypothetical protein M431DRAFT_413061 [Trichoderma harzianum CBS 226.95]PTB55941.1 hypothetical protein M431DRAFT_413061 [Trichoderma harzianum CBS 226.95]
MCDVSFSMRGRPDVGPGESPKSVPPIKRKDTTWYLCVLFLKRWLLCLTRSGPVTKRTRRAPLASVYLLAVSSISCSSLQKRRRRPGLAESNVVAS